MNYENRIKELEGALGDLIASIRMRHLTHNEKATAIFKRAVAVLGADTPNEIERLRQWLQRIEAGTHCPWKAAKAALAGKPSDFVYEACHGRD